MLHTSILNIRDENGLGSVYNELQLSFQKANVTVKDIISERVIQEVSIYNRKATDYQHALVKPTEDETLLNGIKSKIKHHVDTQKQINIAINAFSGNGFFILVDDVQVEDLEQVITIYPNTTVSFIRLTPLVGG